MPNAHDTSTTLKIEGRKVPASTKGKKTGDEKK